jgi:hypothetical protein
MELHTIFHKISSAPSLRTLSTQIRSTDSSISLYTTSLDPKRYCSTRLACFRMLLVAESWRAKYLSPPSKTSPCFTPDSACTYDESTAPPTSLDGCKSVLSKSILSVPYNGKYQSLHGRGVATLIELGIQYSILRRKSTGVRYNISKRMSVQQLTARQYQSVPGV